MTENISKVLGSGHYEAQWVQRSNLVRLTAKGLLPCSNYIAQLEQRPERIIPPMWDMIFYVPDSCQKGLRYFDENVIMVNSSGATVISVRDASGTHEVPIQQSFDLSEEAESTATAKAEDVGEQFIVYAKLPRPDKGHKGCIIAPADSLVTTIHYRAFGPASYADCEMFLQTHCAGSADLFTLAGGEIPWPLAK
ncbi:MAG: hypothetical protein ABJF50_06865 [Paracoccaceae bacterium]